MTTPARFPFVTQQRSGASGLAPYLPIKLSLGDVEIATSGLLDTGAAISVLLYDLGHRLGAIWEKQSQALNLAGNMAAFESRAIVMTASIGDFSPVRLGFAWSRSSTVPLLLGQVNFFQEFEVCFFRSRGVFEVKPK